MEPTASYRSFSKWRISVKSLKHILNWGTLNCQFPTILILLVNYQRSKLHRKAEGPTWRRISRWFSLWFWNQRELKYCREQLKMSQQYWKSLMCDHSRRDRDPSEDRHLSHWEVNIRTHETPWTEWTELLIDRTWADPPCSPQGVFVANIISDSGKPNNILHI